MFVLRTIQFPSHTDPAHFRRSGKIGDFGLSERSRNSHRTSSGASTHSDADVDVSPMWAAPEALRGEEQRPSADVFSLATVACV